MGYIQTRVGEKIMEDNPDYVEQAKDVGMTVQDWLSEQIDYYLNGHNIAIDVEGIWC